MGDICVVTEPCFDCKYTDCVVECPVDSFYADEKMLYINPQECIGCEACIPECPVEAIYTIPQTPTKWVHYVQLNADRAAAILAASQGPLTEKQESLEGPGCGGRKGR